MNPIVFVTEIFLFFIPLISFVAICSWFLFTSKIEVLSDERIKIAFVIFPLALNLYFLPSISGVELLSMFL